jgi:hypothetical protein
VTIGQPSRETEPLIRETYEEFTVGSERVAVIGDPENAHAWLQSTVTEPITP